MFSLGSPPSIRSTWGAAVADERVKLLARAISDEMARALDHPRCGINMKHLCTAFGFLTVMHFAYPAMAGTCGTAGAHYDNFGNPCTPVYGLTGGGGAVTLGLSQQAMTTPNLGSTIAVPANAATAVWTYSSAAKSLVITYNCPSGGLISASDGSAVWASSGGYDWNPGGDQVPNKNLTVTCSSAISVNVAEGH